ncbi:ABC transporter substrate-binding protein [Frigidibacter sp. ROC022]|uniref:ABC transporter substrate-binding protein n=1 Tax=Frigidibacter sp. ROC022 TaxID=2971796 RepID=UPI00215B2788|nr:ABC transporter substrate-binding protein [Frigidibacter sp. ROC022]MCR8724664.1 ABC transporter substrate-binding protein [Frigidibacter sp. ROC022]
MTKSRTELPKRGPSRRDALKGGVSLAAFSAASSLVGLGYSTVARAATRGSPIVLGVSAEANAIHQVAAAGASNQMLPFVQRALLMYDNVNASYKIVPGLAAEMPEILDDGLRFRFRIRDNAYYHDGTKVTADALANWIMMQIDENHPHYDFLNWTTKGRMRTVAKAVAVDELTLDVYMSEFNAAMLDWFTEHQFEGVPISAVEAGADLANEDYAAGPYKVARRDKGNSTVLERFDDFYLEEEGVAPRVGFRIIPEMNSRVAALEAGEVDWIDSITAEVAQSLKDNPNVTVKERKTLYVWFVSMDMRKKPFDDLRVRQAMNYAVDKEALIRDVLGGAAQRSYSPLSPQFGDYYAGDVVKKYDYDPDKARALLAEAGYADGFKTTIYTNTGRAGQLKPLEMSQFLQANWRDIGVDCEIEALEWTAFEQRRTAGEFAIATRGWTPSTGDPDGVLFQNFHSSMVPPTQRNVCFLQDPEVDRLLELGSGTLDPAIRPQAFVDAQKRIVDLAPWVFICHEIAYEAHNAALEGYPAAHPSGWGNSLTYAWKP